ncbi:VC0807 family protein, partial [Nocardia gipuzkoensis]
DDPRLVLAKDPAFSGLICLVMVGSLVVGRPVMFGISRRFQAAEAEDTRRWNLLWNSDSEVRRLFTVSTAVWAAGLGIDAVARLTLILALPVHTAVGLMNPVQWAVIAALFAYTMHARRRIDLGARLRAL